MSCHSRSSASARALPGVAVALALLCGGCPQANMKCLPTWTGPKWSGTGQPLCPAAAVAKSFFEFPWPNDVRKTDNGTIELTGFPDGGALCSLLPTPKTCLTTVLERGSVGIQAFGNNSAVFFTMSEAIDRTSLPQPKGTLDPSVVLVNIQPGPRYGTRVPIKVDFRPEPSPAGYRPANTLVILPYPGFVLAQGERYAAILFNHLKTAAGAALVPSDFITTLDGLQGPQPAGIAALKEQLSAVRQYAATIGKPAASVAAFTVFTTQAPATVAKALGSAIDALPAASEEGSPLQLRDPVAARFCSGTTGFGVVEGKLDVPQFQNGTSPFAESGGDITVEGGVAQQRWTQSSPFQLVVPCGSIPIGGFPVVVLIGTSTGLGHRDAEAFANKYYDPARGIQLPFAVLAISPYLTRERLPPGTVEQIEVRGLDGTITTVNLGGLTFFNFSNPVAGRNNQRQQGAEIAYLARVAEAIDLHAGLVRTQRVLSDRTKIAFYGHSHGAVPAPIGLAMTKRFRAAFLNAPGAGLYHTLVYRGNARLALDLLLSKTPLLGLDPRELDEFHPIMHVLQTISEEGDAANYAADMDPNMDVLLAGGVDDGCSVFEGLAHLAAAAKVQVASYASSTGPLRKIYAIDELQTGPLSDPISLPVWGNAPTGTNNESGRTRLMLELPGRHSTVLLPGNETVVQQFFDFLAPAHAHVPASVPNWTPIGPTPQQLDSCWRAFLIPPLPISPLVSGE